MSQEVQAIFDAILAGDANLAKEKVQTALELKIEPSLLLNNGMIAAMAEVGERFEKGEYFVPEMLISAHAM